MVFEYILIGVLLAAAISLVVFVGFQKSDKEGLSGTIVGGTETYYGKDESVQKNKKLSKWTMIIAIVFAVVVAIVYIVQPDYPSTAHTVDVLGSSSYNNYADVYSSVTGK
ncbi:MAG: preprotein translocase subunit SecG [Clostridia bacterium]|nr:preprotein translocase subunit SecG [Clostridia bacterium]